MIDVLKANPDPAARIECMLSIYPAAPLSMVTTMPGKYYHSLKEPDKAQLCGLFENLMGWRIEDPERKAIQKALKKHYKKHYKAIAPDIDFREAASGYLPLISHLFDISQDLKCLPAILPFDDLWKQQMKHNDSRHLGGINNMDWRVVHAANEAKGKTKEEDDFTKNHLSHLPMYYTTPTKREYVATEGFYRFRIWIQPELADALIQCIDLHSDSAYLGHSEGWVHVELKKL